MRDRARIRKAAPGAWTLTRPRVGFGGPEVFTADSQPEAIALLDRVRSATRRHASAVVELERREDMTDALNPVSPWTPLWLPGTEPAVLPYSHHL